MYRNFVTVIYSEDLARGWNIIWMEGTEVKNMIFYDFQLMMAAVSRLTSLMSDKET